MRAATWRRRRARWASAARRCIASSGAAGLPARRTERAPFSFRSSADRHLVEEAGHRPQLSCIELREVGALDQVLRTARAERPRKAQVVAVRLGLAEQVEAKAR